MRVALLATCLVDTLYPGVGEATVRLLERLGVRVELPKDQTCCGQMHINSGYAGQAMPLVRRTTEVFAGFDAVVTPSGSCAGSIRHASVVAARAAGDDRLVAAAGDLASRTYELSEFLVDILGVVDVGADYPHRVGYHPTCHSLRLLRVGDRPHRLLRAVEGLELVDLPDADQCCGFGGTFAVKNADTSVAMLQDKLASIARSGADRCTATDASCLMQIGGGLRRTGSAAGAVHLAEILASTR